MSRSEHSPKAPHTRTRPFATLRAFLHTGGSSASAVTRIAPLVLAAALLVVLAFSATALADGRIGAPGSAAGQVSFPGGVAVSAKEGDDIYVADEVNSRIDQFEPDGTFVRAFGWSVDATTPEESLQTCTTASGCRQGTIGSGPGQLRDSDEIAVDNSCAEHEPPLTEATTPKCSEFDPSYGDVYVVDQNNFRVEKFGPAGEFLLMFGGGVDQGGGTPAHPGNLCTAEYITNGDTCGAGVPGTGPSHFYEEEPLTQAGGFKSWFHLGSNSIAVGPDGTVYVGDYGRIQEFDLGGAFSGEFKLPDAEPQFVTSLALDAEGNIFERSAITESDGTVIHQVPGVREWSPAHFLLHTFDAGLEEAGSEPAHIALDQAGDLFVSDLNGGQFTFRAFRPDATLYAEFTSDQVTSFDPKEHTPPRADGIVVGNAAGKLYASSLGPEGAHLAVIPLPVPGPPAVTGLHVTNLEPKTATLNAVVNPEQFKTEYHFEYTTTDFSNCGLPANPNCTKTATENLGSVSREDAVSEAISGLLPATVYHYRVIAESECHGPSPTLPCAAESEETFETLPNVGLRDFTTQTVGPELVTLKAELNPNNGGTTHYKICYGTEPGPAEPGHNAQGCVEGTLNGVGSEFEPITATFPDLQPNTTYHYQLLATNSNGEIKTVDQTFQTELSFAEERAAETSCPNLTLREENNSLALPDCRAYEQVSPAFKAGSAVSGDELSPSGEAAAFRSLGIFAGAATSQTINPYLAHRTATGWLTESADAGRPEPGYILSSLRGYDAELGSWIIVAQQGRTKTDAEFPPLLRWAYYRGSAGPSLSRVSPVLSPPSGFRQSLANEIVAQSADFSHLYIAGTARLLPESEDPLPDGTGTGTRPTRIYEVSGAGGPTPTVSLAAEIPTGLNNSHCGLDQKFSVGSAYNASSADGSTLFYDAPLETTPGAPCEDKSSNEGENPNKVALFARTAPAPAIRISARPSSQCHSPSPCAAEPEPLANASFAGASPDARLAWFTTPQPLIDSDTDATNDLYLAKLENGQLTELVQASAGEAGPSHPTPGKGAAVQGVLALSQEGTHIAFTATGVLTEAPNGEGEKARAGAENLYLYDATAAELKFVATSGGNAQFTPDGRYLLFTSSTRLTLDDTDNAADIYRYDFQTGQLARVSIGYRGNDANGNDDLYDDAFENNLGEEGSGPRRLDVAAADSSRSISADGTVAIFATAAPLVSRDTNKAPDIYEWEEFGHGTCHEAGGCVSLVSSGLDPHGAQNGVLSSSGRDIAFITGAGLVPADSDGLGDIYDAREGGGFPQTPPPIPCGGNEICHHEPPPPPSPPKIATEGETGGNGKQHLQCGKGRHRVTKHGQVRCVPNKKHHQAKKHHKRAANTNRGGAK